MKPEQAALDASMPKALPDGAPTASPFAIADSRARGVIDRAGIETGASARFA